MDEASSDFPARRSRGKLWHEGEPPLLTRAAANQPPQHSSQHQPSNTRASRRQHPNIRAREQAPAEEEDPSVSHMIKQPETRPISQEQLVAEVKGIYAGLVMVESKCIEVDSAQSSQGETATKLNNEQWQALIALHRTLLHEHHDFFLASQHPSASPALRRLASKYAMPARMWRHGIHSFLELLRHRLPASLEHMLTFIYLAYSMMALLYETVPAFEDTWIECLGDLGRYRMAIEDEDIRDREIWTAVSRLWYSKASDKAPTTGRLHHHLAILARPNAVQQLFYYTKSLCVAIPFKSARDSIMTLFDPILNGSQNRLQPVDLAFVKAHGILFIVSNRDEKEKPLPKSVEDFMADFLDARSDYLTLLDTHIAHTTRGWMDSGAFSAIANCNSLLEYGKTESNAQGEANGIMSIINPPTTENDVPMEGSDDRALPAPSNIFGVASGFVKDCDSLVFRRYADNSVLPYVHVRLAFMFYMATKPLAMEHLERHFPWSVVVLMLNSLLHGFQHFDRIQSQEFPRPSERKPNERPLPEDWDLRGLLWTDSLFPTDWFDNRVDEDEKSFELPSMTDTRRERVLWLGWNLASHGKWLIYDDESKQFKATDEFHKEIQDFPAEDATLAGKVDAISSISTFNSTASTTTMTVDSSKSWKSGEDASEAGDDMSMVVEKSEAD